MNRIILLLLLMLISSSDFVKAEGQAQDHGYGNRPRGVPLNKAAFYEEKAEFQCLDGSKNIPFERVNDDYCDCLDGSDEPGTSACINGQFHCINLGHKPRNIFASMVNDFICDCCDGSDEWDSGVSCPNICSQMGAQARKEAEEYKKVAAAGFLKRAEYAKEGEKLIKEKTSGVDELRKELDNLSPLKVVAETKKSDAEEKERAAKEVEDKEWDVKRDALKRAAAELVFGDLDSDKDGKLTILDFVKIVDFDNDHNGEVTEEEARTYLAGDDELSFEAFFERAFDDIRRLFKSRTRPSAVEEKKEPEEEQQEGEDRSDDDDQIEDEYSSSAVREDEEWEKRPPYTEETQKLIDEATKARNDFNEALSKVSELENKVREAESFVDFDYGKDHAWAALKGQCFELNENQYTYKVCMFDKTTQKENNAHHDVALGYWGTWDGPESNKYSAQKYERGQSCWNGPERSTKIDIRCGDENKLVEVSEPNKCEYNFVLLSPAACEDPAKLKDQEYHAEL